MTFGMALIHNGADRKRGYDMLRTLRETCIEEQFALNIVSASSMPTLPAN